jgi:hypothetical protein
MVKTTRKLFLSASLPRTPTRTDPDIGGEGEPDVDADFDVPPTCGNGIVDSPDSEELYTF